MSDYERSLTVQASPDQVFAFVTDMSNMPKYLPTVHNAQPQQGERIRVQGEARGHAYDSDGYFRVDQANRRMEWGSDGENQYSGWLEVDDMGHESEVTVHLSFTPNPGMEKEFQEAMGSRDAAIEEGLEKALLSIQNILEGQGGKVESVNAT